jgi:hypothetical protein
MMASPSIRRRADRATFSAMTPNVRPPVLLLLIASSALGFRFGARR